MLTICICVFFLYRYDRQKLTPKEIQNVQYIACMNPSSGSSTIDPRLHRHFITFAVNTPNVDNQRQIFEFWLQRHFENLNFSSHVTSMVPAIVSASIAIHNNICSQFQSSASKFLYVFNLRDIASIIKGNVHLC